MLGFDPNTPRRTICLAGSPFSSKVAISKFRGISYPLWQSDYVRPTSGLQVIGLVFTRGVREYCSYPTPVVPSGCKSGDVGVYDRIRTCVGQNHNLLPKPLGHIHHLISSYQSQLWLLQSKHIQMLF